MRIGLRLAVTALGGMLWGVVPALGQEMPARQPYRGLFGGAGSGSGDRRSLDLNVSLFEVFDDSLRSSGSTMSRPGFYTGVTPSLTFGSERPRMQIHATAGSNMRYDAGMNRLSSVSHSVAGGFSAGLARRTTLSFNQAVSYAPSYSRLSGLFAGAGAGEGGNVAGLTTNSAVGPATEAVVGRERSYSYSTTLALTQAVARQATVSFNSGFQYTDFGGAAGVSDYRSYYGGGRVSYRVSRNGALRLGYGYRLAAYSRNNRPVTHDIDVGVDYLWPLTRARTTTVAFSIGSSVVEGRGTTAAGENQRQYRAMADVSLTHQIGRSWQVQGAYRRGLGFIEALTAPVFNDAVTLTTDGFLNRRADVLVSASYSKGAPALTGSTSDFKTYSGQARVRFAVSSTWATYVEYHYYSYDFTRSVQLAPGLSPRLTRNSVRVGLTLWVPIMRR